MAKIKLLPQVVDLALYAGDGVTLRLNVRTPAGQPWPLDGEVKAQIRKERADTDALESFAVDVTDAASGVATLKLSGGQTTNLVTGGEDFSGAWDVQLTPTDEEPTTLAQGAVSCALDVSR